jgi:putative hydrolase of the HAD superfamily
MANTTHVLFDFFGTLVEYSASWIHQGFERSHAVLRENGATLEYAAFVEAVDAVFAEHEERASSTLDEYTMDEVCRALLTRTLPRAPSDAALRVYRDTYLAEWSKGVRYIPGVPELLAQLAERFVLVLVTNTHHAEFVRGHLAAMAIENRFTAVVASDEHGRRKPSPCIFERALSLSGGTREGSLYVGDSFAADYRGATGAGLRCVLIDPERRHDVPDTDRLNDILALRGHLSVREADA